jgi:hypothetical protein
MASEAIRNKARARIHVRARRLCTYRAPDGVETIVGVRVFARRAEIGDVDGIPDAVTVSEDNPDILFHLSEGVTPARGAVVIFAEEAFRIDYVHPRDGETVLAQSTRLSPAQRAAL